jgi:type IV pilus assembly protein PilN
LTSRTALNFASEPFRRDRPILVASIAVGLLLAGLLALLSTLAAAERNRAAENRQVMSRLEGQLRSLSAEQAKLEATLRQRENAEVLERSQFLNVLLLRKATSWTKIFSDLEGVMPHNVRLVSVRPQVNPQNELLLDMVVGAQSNEPVIELLMQLEASPLFGATSVHSWLPPSQSEPLYRYRVSVNYAQKL